MDSINVHLVGKGSSEMCCLSTDCLMLGMRILNFHIRLIFTFDKQLLVV